MRSFRSALFGAAAVTVIAAMPAAAQEGSIIRDVVIQGNQRIEADTVKSYMSIAEGDPYDSTKVDKSLKSLFATGLFADVTIRHEGDSVVVRVVENPIINRIAFEGNHRAKTEQLQTEISLRPRTVYTRTKVQNDVKRILEILRRNGRYAATVEPKLIELEQNRVDLVFEINEGPATYVGRIDFVGNKKFTDDRLRESLQTKEERWYRFLTQDDTYDPDRLNYDRELLRRHYLKNGYADFRVVSTVAELSPTRDRFYVTFTLEEGERYKLGKIDLQSALPDLKTEDLKPLLASLKTGDWYNADEVENVVQALTDAVGNKGYAFIEIKPQLKRDPEKRTVDILFDIQEGPRVYVERIDIQGNTRTLDKVIRREFRLVEGDAFNTAKLRRSKERIKDLNFFEKVDVNNVPSETAPDRTVIKVDVEEKPTGELSFGVGWSSAVGALLDVGARERNLLGRGQDLKINGQLSQKRNSIDMGFTEPYFMDHQLAAGFDLFAINTDYQNTSSYNASTKGGDLRLGYQYSEHLRHDWRYTLSVDEVSDVDDSASLYIKEQAGTNVASYVGHVLTYDRRDSRVDPTEGYYLKYGNDVSGLGGTERFLRGNASAGQYFKIGEQDILLLSATAAAVHGWGGKPVLINQRLFLGGDTLRGFKDAGVSPRDTSTEDALGALWDATATAELTFPLGLPKELGLQGKLFSDVGTVGDTDKTVNGATVAQSQAIRLSLGTGVIWKSPMGPINVDLAIPVMKDSNDKTEVFRLNFGTRF